ncbi:hypothetical protein Vretifemale_4180, partial [Volvox reticuliferus]
FVHRFQYRLDGAFKATPRAVPISGCIPAAHSRHTCARCWCSSASSSCTRPIHPASSAATSLPRHPSTSAELSESGARMTRSRTVSMHEIKIPHEDEQWQQTHSGLLQRNENTHT